MELTIAEMVRNQAFVCRVVLPTNFVYVDIYLYLI